MHRQPSRITGLLFVPPNATVDWDMLATEYRTDQANRLPDLISQRRGMIARSGPKSWRLPANRQRLLRELEEALFNFLGYSESL